MKRGNITNHIKRRALIGLLSGIMFSTLFFTTSSVSIYAQELQLPKKRKMTHYEKVKELQNNGMTKDEAEVAVLINEYRMSLGLMPLKISKSLTIVGRTHVKDSNENHPENQMTYKGQAILHSWSNKGNWSAGVITENSEIEDYNVMWDKPRELSKYRGDGYEISTGFRIKNRETGPKMTAMRAVNNWKGSPEHNAVMITANEWKDLTTFGVGIEGSYSHVWFGSEEDPAGYYDNNPDDPMMTTEPVKKETITESENKVCWFVDNGSWYYADKDGNILKSTWLKDANKWYYLEADGKMSSNEWVNSNDSWFWATSSGRISENEWVFVNDSWYYAENDGYIVMNQWKEINGKWYFFNQSGALLVSTTTPDGYKVNANGEWI